jgi:hypothetical protein
MFFIIDTFSEGAGIILSLLEMSQLRQTDGFSPLVKGADVCGGGALCDKTKGNGIRNHRLAENDH